MAPVLLKLYESTLWRAMEKTMVPLPPQVLAFREKRQTMDVSEALRTLLSKAQEWGKALAIRSLDIKAAFDWMQSLRVPPPRHRVRV